MNSPQPWVYVLLLNYGGVSDTLACLDSLKQLCYPNFQVVVVDNASPNDSVVQFRQRLAHSPGEFELIESSKNLGYSGGNNLGIQWVLAQQRPEALIWLLNNDTTVDPESLSELVVLAQRTNGLVGSLLRYPDQRYQQVGTRLNWWTGSAKGYPESKVTHGMAVETLTGASLLVPAKVFQQIGLLDESFFLYFEDGEFSIRCAKKGFSRNISLKSVVYHSEGATTGSKSLSTQYYYHRNRLRLFFMYASSLQKLTIACYTVFRYCRSVVKWKINPASQPQDSLRVQYLAICDFWRGVQGPCPHDLVALCSFENRL